MHVIPQWIDVWNTYRHHLVYSWDEILWTSSVQEDPCSTDRMGDLFIQMKISTSPTQQTTAAEIRRRLLPTTRFSAASSMTDHIYMIYYGHQTFHQRLWGVLRLVDDFVVIQGDPRPSHDHYPRRHLRPRLWSVDLTNHPGHGGQGAFSWRRRRRPEANLNRLMGRGGGGQGGVRFLSSAGRDASVIERAIARVLVSPGQGVTDWRRPAMSSHRDRDGGVENGLQPLSGEEDAFVPIILTLSLHAVA